MKFRRNMSRSTRGFILLLATTLPATAATNTQDHVNGNFTSLADAFWQLTNLTPSPESSLHRRPQFGGQNFTHCCLLAVNASLEFVDGFVVKSEPDFIKTTVSDLLAANDAGQFPCTATWNGDRYGAPIVETPASWLESTCKFSSLPSFSHSIVCWKPTDVILAIICIVLPVDQVDCYLKN